MHGKSAPIERQPFPFPYSLFNWNKFSLWLVRDWAGLLFPFVTEIHRIDSRASRLPSPQRTAPDKIVVVKHCRYCISHFPSQPSSFPSSVSVYPLSSLVSVLTPPLLPPSDFSNLLPPLLPPLLLHIYHAHPPLPPSISFLILFISFFFFFPTFRPGTSFSSHFPFSFSRLYLHSFSFSHQSPPFALPFSHFHLLDLRLGQ